MLAVDAGEILGILGHDLDQVIGGPCHQMAFQNVGHAGHFTLERVQQILGLRRRGKYLLMDLSDGMLLIHLGMSGRMVLTPTRPNTQTAHEHLVLETDEGIKTSTLVKGRSYARQIGVSHNVINPGPGEVVFVEVEMR